MEIKVKVCDSCASEGVFSLAGGWYETPEKNVYNACNSHMKQIEIYGWKFVEFERMGDIYEEFFYQ